LWTKSGSTHGEVTRDRVETDMDFVDKVGWIADACQRTPNVYVVLPAIEFLITLERKVVLLFFCFDQEAIGLEVCPFDVGYISKQDHSLLWRSLATTKDGKHDSISEGQLFERGGECTSFLCIDKTWSTKTRNFGLHSQLVNPSSFIVTVPLLMTCELKTASELGRLGEPPMPEYEGA
jgi:hypothetical protein